MTEKQKATTIKSKAERIQGKYLLPITLVLVLITAVNIYIASGSNSAINEKIRYTGELAKPAVLEVTEISADCKDCFNTSLIAGAIKQFKATVSEKKIEPASSKAKALIQKYNITRLPTIIVTGDTAKAGIDKVWSSAGTVESDGALVMRIGAPFMDVQSGKIHGKAEVVFMNYSSCKGCYDVTVHRNVLERFGLLISDEKTVDAGSAEGKALVAKYNITKVPTVLVSPEAKYYDALQGIWNQVGTIESDGWYVFRSMEAMQEVTYYDLAQNKLINGTA